MDKLDQYVEKEIIPHYTLGGRRTENKEYKALAIQAKKHRRHGNWEKVQELKKLMQTIPSKDPNDPDFKRLHYIRYADDWLIGISGNKKDADDVKREISTFLDTKLNLKLSEAKTLITHARNEKARFLGYDIHVLHSNTKHDHRGQRSINGAIGLRLPEEKLKNKMTEYMSKGKPIHRKERTINSDYDIIAQYQAEFRGFAQYYLLAYNAHTLSKLKRTMELSLAKTLANKYKTTVNKIFKRFKTVHETKDGSYKVLRCIVERKDKKPLVAYFGGIKLAYQKGVKITDEPKQVYSVRSELINRLLSNKCELCGKEGKVQMHHVNKLKNLIKNGRKEKPEWMRRMIAIKRKTLAVCQSCHNDIHQGKYHEKKLRSS
jgi:hypothetical protein